MNTEYKITKASEEDLQEILDLQHLAYQSEAALFGRQDIQPLMETLDELAEEYKAGTVLKMTDENGKIIGSVRGKEADGTLYIGKLMVHPDHQRKGYGRKLVTAIEECCPGRRYELFTSTRSINNIRLYESLGYKKFDERDADGEIRFVYLEK
ncbi:MAG: GNAT family N-acetyltransferase [Saccharofermentans sp.]|nr:GNAT family N-acetyltransferase [Saccharofermentans sp.]